MIPLAILIRRMVQISNIGGTNSKWPKGDYLLDFELTSSADDHANPGRTTNAECDLDPCIDLNLTEVNILSSPEFVNLDNINVSNNTSSLQLHHSHTVKALINCMIHLVCPIKI